MPRPKRTKVASSAPTLITAPVTTHPPQERNIPYQSAGQVTTKSDESEGIVTTSTTLRIQRGVERGDVFMSGGLGTGDAQDPHRKPGAMRRKPAPMDTTRMLEQTKAIEGLKKRREAALAKRKGSVMELLSSIPASGAEDEGFPTGGKDPVMMKRDERVSPETERARETPGAETSFLALANFKRRPRQPSILQVPVQQGVDAVDDLYNAINIEEIKHAAAEHPEHIQPEDESTPFIVSKIESQIESILSVSPLSLTPESISESSSKKRKLTSVKVQVPRSFPPEARPSPLTEYQHMKNYDSPDLHNDEQKPSSEQPEAPSDQELPPQIWSDTLAPPLSSSPSQLTSHTTSSPKRPTSTITAQTKRKQPSRNNYQSNHKSSRTKLLNLPPTSHALTFQSLSTATLRTLLPRRRTRTRASVFDIPSSDSVDAEDEEAETSTPVSNEDNDDELSRPFTKKPGTRNQALTTASEAAGISKKLLPAKRRRATAAPKKAAAAEGAGAKTPSTKTKARRKYTRHVGPRDGVNTKGGGGDEGDGRIRIGGPEVERAARWFREVAKWELEFEEVTGSSDSMMRDWR